jgi:hypothetical protein
MFLLNISHILSIEDHTVIDYPFYILPTTPLYAFTSNIRYKKSLRNICYVNTNKQIVTKFRMNDNRRSEL